MIFSINLCKNFSPYRVCLVQVNYNKVDRLLIAFCESMTRFVHDQFAKDLLEEHLTGISRNGEALALLAELYGQSWICL